MNWQALDDSIIPLLKNIRWQPFSEQVQSWEWGNSNASNANAWAIGYDETGRITSYPLGHALNGGVVRSLNFDAAGQIRGFTHSGLSQAQL